ncbi:MAG: Flp family type IVb pilin [Ponticaulis sp.]|nr:Flp family type IVb pilin [Ponticaulis sp.]
MRDLLKRFRRDESGAEVIEYAILAGLIAIVIVAGVTAVGQSAGGKFEQLDEEWDAAAGG